MTTPLITLADIMALPAALRANHSSAEITAALSLGRTRVVPHLGGIGTVLELLGPTSGAALLDALQALEVTTPAVKWAMVLIGRGELDFGSAATRSMIDQLAAQGVMTLVDAQTLKAVAEQADPLDELTIRQLCWSDTGVWQA